MRTLLKFIFEYLLQTYRKVAEKGAHGQEPMNFFKLGSLMQEHKLMKTKSPMTSPKLREFKET
jgi:hypothetical protein